MAEQCERAEGNEGEREGEREAGSVTAQPVGKAAQEEGTRDAGYFEDTEEDAHESRLITEAAHQYGQEGRSYAEDGEGGEEGERKGHGAHSSDSHGRGQAEAGAALARRWRGGSLSCRFESWIF